MRDDDRWDGEGSSAEAERIDLEACSSALTKTYAQTLFGTQSCPSYQCLPIFAVAAMIDRAVTTDEQIYAVSCAQTGAFSRCRTAR